mgnify:CR=1 FL=1|jgi:hypothetical protein
MTNYIINECLTNDVYILSAATTYASGATVQFSIVEDLFCGTVGEVTLSAITTNIVLGHLYDDCCACLSNDGLEPLNFQFIRCGTEEEINIESAGFCDQFVTPTIGMIYEIQFGLGTPFCATFTGLTSTGETFYSYVSGPFDDCSECNAPISAGTEYNVCVIDCSGNTVSITPPHPTWTNEQGHAVVLLDAIALGGINGLNS